MRLAVRHTTRYLFSQPSSRGLQRLRLRPKSTHGQSVIDWTMTLEGAVVEANYDDQHCNHTTLVSVIPGVDAMTITCEGVIETSDNAGVIGVHSGFMPLWGFLAQSPLTQPGAKMRALAATVSAGSDKPLDCLHRLSERVLEAVRYEAGHTDVDTSAEAAMAAGYGVCQDHAHIFIGVSRALGIPARYVSGYLMMDDRIEQDASHGWAEAHVPSLGWVAFDVSNEICPDARYVRIASGCDYREAAPVTGISYGDGETTLAVSLAVEQQLSEQ